MLALTAQAQQNAASSQTFTVNGVSFKMVYVEGGTFTMGATSEQGSDAYSDEKPAHKVTLSSYSIGETEVTQALWQAVMGSNPSKFRGSNRPVEMVSWNDCQTFINKLNSLTGKRFRLPTEAEWEFAARGGNKSKGYKYSGSNNLSAVAWYKDNSGSKTHPVKTKAANELGLYDMSGNVWEWCQDWKGSYSSSAQADPMGPSTGSIRVYRGGSWGGSTMYGRVSYRNDDKPGNRSDILGLRIVLQQNEQSLPQQTVKTAPAVSSFSKSASTSFSKSASPSSSKSTSTSSSKSTSSTVSSSQAFTVKGVSFKMIRVEGGTFTMGATSEQGSDASLAEKPAHRVTLSSYSIGETEVTQALWLAVMGSNPSDFEGSNRPVEKVSWEDCQEFVSKLNALTGKRFRLPTEAEWEFAARGGNKSKGYKYSGSNDLNAVAWYHDNSGYETHPVKTKAPNELGLYDMSGNVMEWCQDYHGVYDSSAQTNPKGPDMGPYCVWRGGSGDADAGECRVSCRKGSSPVFRFGLYGLRLAL